MPKNQFLTELTALGEISENLEIFLTSRLQIDFFKKKAILYKQGSNLQKMYYIISGLVIGNTFLEERQHTCWFLKENDFILDLHSFTYGEPARQTAIAAEDCVVLYLSYQDAKTMFEVYPEANFIGRKINAMYYCHSNKRTELMMLLKTADRYKKFEKEFKWALGRVKLGYVASYLNMTSEALSRVRRG